MVPFPNADQVNEFIESESDPVVRSLMRLVWGEFLDKTIAGERPDGACDLMYCFTALRKAFHRKNALETALKGEFGDYHNLEWADEGGESEPLAAESRRAV